MTELLLNHSYKYAAIHFFEIYPFEDVYVHEEHLEGDATYRLAKTSAVHFTKNEVFSKCDQIHRFLCSGRKEFARKLNKRLQSILQYIHSELLST